MLKPVAALASLSLLSLPCAGQAKEFSEEDLVRIASECAYVITEVGADVGTRSTGQDWLSVLNNLSQKTGIDPIPHIDAAKAKYRRSERKMGADYTFKRMKERARNCDEQI